MNKKIVSYYELQKGTFPSPLFCILALCCWLKKNKLVTYFTALYAGIFFVFESLWNEKWNSFNWIFISFSLQLSIFIYTARQPWFVPYLTPFGISVEDKRSMQVTGLFESDFSIVFSFWCYICLLWIKQPNYQVFEMIYFQFGLQGTAVFCLSSFQYLTLAVIYSRGPPYRKTIFSNTFLCACLG